jgi:aspartate racemase
MQVPDEADRERINGFIFDELVYGRFLETTWTYFSNVIASGRERGADAVVLGCTEIPLLIQSADSTLPILDSTRILARAALREAAMCLQRSRRMCATGTRTCSDSVSSKRSVA